MKQDPGTSGIEIAERALLELMAERGGKRLDVPGVCIEHPTFLKLQERGLVYTREPIKYDTPYICNWYLTDKGKKLVSEWGYEVENPGEDAFKRMIERDIETAERGRRSALEEIERIKAEYEKAGWRIPMSVQDRINTLEDSVKFHEAEIERLKSKLEELSNPGEEYRIRDRGPRVADRYSVYRKGPGRRWDWVSSYGTWEEAESMIEKVGGVLRRDLNPGLVTEEPGVSENTFNGISKEGYYLNFNRDEIFKALIAGEGHFRNISGEDRAGFLNCVVKHLADAEGHCDEAISHALIAEGEESSRRFLELRDMIRDLRRHVQSRPISREEGIRKIRGVRRSFEGFNPDYDVSKCETCGDPSIVMEDINKILSEMKETPLAVAAHEHDDLLLMEREMAEKLIAKLSEKYGVEPPKLEILETCHEPSDAAYTDGNIYVCRSGVNLHILAHEFWHHVQARRGGHLDEGEAEKFSVELFVPPIQKGLYKFHNHSHNDSKMTKTLRDIGVIYGGQHAGQLLEMGLQWADLQRPEGIAGMKISLLGDIIGAIGGVAGALYLREPWDLISALVGGHMSTDLWRFAAQALPAGLPLAVPPGLVYAPPTMPTSVRPTPAMTRGRYTVTG